MSDIKRVWTAEEILAWAGRVSAWDTDDTATYLAKCTRLMAAFERWEAFGLRAGLYEPNGAALRAAFEREDK